MSFLTQLRGIDPTSLGLIQRIMLVTDGTLTNVLEAVFCERIGIEKLGTQIVAAADGVQALGLDESQSVMERQVRIRGQSSGRTYVYAETTLALDRIPGKFREALVGSDTPLGRLWSEYRLETRKDLLSVQIGKADSLAAVHFGPGDSEDILTRSYTVASGGLPIMLITEHFPLRYSPGPGWNSESGDR